MPPASHASFLTNNACTLSHKFCSQISSSPLLQAKTQSFSASKHCFHEILLISDSRCSEVAADVNCKDEGHTPVKNVHNVVLRAGAVCMGVDRNGRMHLDSFVRSVREREPEGQGSFNPALFCWALGQT